MLKTVVNQAKDRSASLLQYAKLPERFKGTLVEKWARYWNGLVFDYGEVFRDTAAGARNRPFRASIYAAVIGTGYAAIQRNPNEVVYRSRVVEARDEVGLISTSIRNPNCQNYLDDLETLFNQGLIRRVSLGIFSLYWVADVNAELALPVATVDFLKPAFANWHTRVIEIGFWNKFWVLEDKMVDFDVNPAEWD